jgi:two-component system, NtrC family, sensor kinase
LNAPGDDPEIRAHGIGLRTQIMVALAVGFALSVILLGFATARLGSRAIDAERMRAAEGVARALASASSSEREAMGALDSIVGTGGVVGAEIWIEGRRFARGRASGAETVSARSESARVRLFVEPADGAARRSLPGLLFLYVGITAAAILIVTYVLLGRSIVRPVEELTRASERIARASGSQVRVPIRGAAEVARLAIAFNEMQSQLARDRAELEQRLADLTRTARELETAQRSLVQSEKMASVGRLAAGIAHEIGNPLSAILGLVELTLDGDLSAQEQREFLSRVKKETERIHRIIRDLLDFARREPIEEIGASCDLAEVVDDAVRLVGPQKDLRLVTIERRFEEPTPKARGSKERLAQVVLNLLLNAADAIEGEGTITFEVREKDDRVELAVQDSGPGIAEEVRVSLFEPFVTTKPAGRGTGLGLAVCHTIVERLGGTIEASNAPEGGARFVVRLPRA